MDHTDLSRILSLIISVLTDPYDRFVDKLRADGRITEEEVQEILRLVNDTNYFRNDATAK